MKINLLPPQERPQGFTRKKFFIIMSVCVLFIYTVIFGYNQYVLWSLSDELSAVNSQYQLLRPAEQKMLAALAKQTAYNQRNSVLVKLSKDKKSWHAVLSRLGYITPPKVWLTQVAAVDRKYVKILGQAANYSELAAFLANMANDGIFTAPMLISADQDNRSNLTKFEIVVKIKET